MEQVLNVLLQITIYSGVLFAAVMLFKKALGKKMSPLLHYAVWVILIARLLMPVTIDSGWSPIQIPYSSTLAQQTGQAQTADLKPTFTFPPSASADQLSAAASAPINDQTAALAAQPEPQVAAEPGQAFSWNEMLVAVWLSGVCVCLVFMLASYYMLRRRIAQDGFSAPKRLAELLDECKQEMGISANIKILSCYGLTTPALLAPATVLMPMESLVSMDEEQVRFSLRHELMHYKRRDHLVSVLLSVLQAVYWFNPFVWLAFRQMRLDMEVACDNAVVKQMSSREKSGYALLILSLFTKKTCQRVLGLAQGNTKRIAEKRIRGIYMDEKSRPAVKAISFAVAGVLLVACFTTACQPVMASPAPTSSATGIFAQATQPSETQAATAPTVVELLSPTTGLPGNTAYRPVQVQIGNEEVDRLQYGLQAADIVYEALIEADATRFSAIYNDTLPVKVGPIRSSRVYFQYIQNEWDSIYIHDGGPYVAAFPKSYSYSSENGGDMRVRVDFTRQENDDVLSRESVLTPAYANVQAAEDKYSYVRTQRNPVFRFDANVDYSKYQSFSKIDIPFTGTNGDNQVEYTYNQSTGKLTRYNDGKPFLDAETNKAVVVQNVIVQYVTDTLLPNEEGKRLLAVIGSGKAEFFVGGRHMTGTWQKTDRHAGTVYKLDDGTDLVLKPGNTWIELQPDSKNVVITGADSKTDAQQSATPAPSAEPFDAWQTAPGVTQEAQQTAMPTPHPTTTARASASE